MSLKPALDYTGVAPSLARLCLCLACIVFSSVSNTSIFVLLRDLHFLLLRSGRTYAYLDCGTPILLTPNLLSL